MSLPSPKDSLLRRGLKLGHLRLLAALGEGQALTAAAAEVGISQPAASRLVAEIEAITGHRIRERAGRGIEMTPVGLALARRARRVQIELDDAARDLAEIAAGDVGHVRFGTVAGAALDWALPALLDERTARPGVTFDVTVAASDLLCAQLLEGRLDFALGRLPDAGLAAELSYRALATEPVALVVRPDHPVLSACDIPAVLALDWILPPVETLMTRTVLSRLQALGLPRPALPFATGSVMLTLALLSRTDAVAALPTSIVRHFATSGNALAVLPLDLAMEVDHFGMIARRNLALTPAARRLAERIQRVA